MSALGFVAELFWRSLFSLARTAFLAQGLALACAVVAVPWAGAPDAPAWLSGAVRACLAIGAVLFAAGILLGFARRLPLPSPEAAQGPAWPWPWLLALTLLGLPALAYTASAELLTLWREILVRLDALGDWSEMVRAGPYGGLVVLPLLVALFVPGLEFAALLFLTAAPLGFLPLLLGRRRRFPRLYAALVVCQVGLVLASLLAADAFSRLSADAAALMRADRDPELHRIANELEGAAAALVATARALVAPTLAYAAWLALLSSPRRAGAFFRAGAQGARTAPPRRVRAALAAVGAVLLAFASADALRPRVRFAGSDPAPGARLLEPPPAVQVRFANALDPSSTLRIARSSAASGDGVVASEVSRSDGLDGGDPTRRTLSARTAGLADGLYHVAWSAQPAAGGRSRSGSFAFAIGRGVPDAALVGARAPEERDAGARGLRHACLGAALLLGLAALLPRSGPARP